MSPYIKGLVAFLGDLRACPSRVAEEGRISTELAKIRKKLAAGAGGGAAAVGRKRLSGYDRKKYVWKLVYCHMLGVQIDFGHMEIIHLISSEKYSEKVAGYIACSLLLSEHSELLRLCVNLLRQDLQSSTPNVVSLALSCVANVTTEEMAENLHPIISKLIGSENVATPTAVRRKALLTLCKLCRVNRDVLTCHTWPAILAQIFEVERDSGCLLAASGLTIGILEALPPDSRGSSSSPSSSASDWRAVQNAVCTLLWRVVTGPATASSLTGGGAVGSPGGGTYGGVAVPWLQVKLLRILQFFPVEEDLRLLTRLNEILQAVLVKSSAGVPQASSSSSSSRRGTPPSSSSASAARSNMQHAVIFEAVNLAIHLENAVDLKTKQHVATLLGSFVGSKDADIRYLGLEAMARMAADEVIVHALRANRKNLFALLHEPDLSLKKQALNVLFALCDKST
eukprot:GHVT01039200.1.p1 GENE.GHVT01039200.1~~GHVT01039200.1.p1  ORF type:complete len:454 (+),score=129.09 GHVT01039200.1:1110-2471(+)